MKSEAAGETLAESTIRQRVQDYFDGVNSERYRDVARLFTERGILIAPGTDPRVGHDSITSYFEAALRPYPIHEDRPTRVIVAGTVATVEIHFTGSLANGRVLEFDAVDVFDFDDRGRITQLSSWYDSHRVRSRLREATGRTPGDR